MPLNLSGTIAAGNVSQSVFGKARPTQYQGYQIQNTSSGVLYVEDNGQAATSASLQVAAGTTYTTPDGCQPVNGVQIMGATTGQTYVFKAY
jgi:hypothetical protein